MNTTIFPITAFQDNYLWLFHEPESNRAVVVDPGDAEPVEAALEKFNLILDTILLTHHHLDHTGGLEALCRKRQVRVIGPGKQRFPRVTHPVKAGDHFVAAELEFQVLDVPGHTSDHIAYYSNPGEEPPLLFCGDTLFAAGCGRLFEGTAEQMYQSLNKLGGLPDETRVFCAHEYTLDNLAFALAVEPESQQLKQRLKHVVALRNSGKPTVPSTIGEEKQTNPFMRPHMQSVRESVSNWQNSSLDNPVEVFAATRRWKDEF